jgi:adenosine deaminase
MPFLKIQYNQNVYPQKKLVKSKFKIANSRDFGFNFLFWRNTLIILVRSWFVLRGLMPVKSWYSPTTAQLNQYRSLPKVELHRHLEGSLRLNTLLDIARTHGITLPVMPELSAAVQMQTYESLTFSNFLSKFQILRMFYRSPEVIKQVTREAVADAAMDGVLHLELRFTPVALTRAQDHGLGNVMDWVLEGASQAAHEHGISVVLIASVNRHESVELAEEVVALAIERQQQGIVGLDLAGNESDFPAAPFASLFQRAKAAGLHITAHAGEWNGAQNVREAIEDLQAERIGHGVRVMEDPAVVALAREARVPFEVCITSNYQSGVVSSLTTHPLPQMIAAGLYVTINTDDPSISQITLSDEYRLVEESLGFNRAQLAGRVLAAAEAAFITADRRQVLIEKIMARLRQENIEPA